jgi:hypothetical protein
MTLRVKQLMFGCHAGIGRALGIQGIRSNDGIDRGTAREIVA